MDHIVAAMAWKMYLLSNMGILGIHVEFEVGNKASISSIS